MDLLDALRSTPATREFTDRAVSDEELAGILDNARFAPSGGNRQAWGVVVLKDPAIRAQLRDLYLDGWYPYLTLSASGLTPFSPLADREAEAAALEQVEALTPAFAGDGQGFAERLDHVPVLLAITADLDRLAAVDRDLDRYSFAGGASVYPFAWSILLAARARGLGGVITTMAVRREPEVAKLLGLSSTQALACVIALGEPARQVSKLRRAEVASFTTVDRADGPPLLA